MLKQCYIKLLKKNGGLILRFFLILTSKQPQYSTNVTFYSQVITTVTVLLQKILNSINS